MAPGVDLSTGGPRYRPQALGVAWHFTVHCRGVPCGSRVSLWSQGFPVGPGVPCGARGSLWGQGFPCGLTFGFKRGPT